MNISEMHISFKQGLDKFDSKNYPNLEEEEIDLLLNQAQDAFLKQRYGYNNSTRTSFEETQKRIEDLKSLVKQDILTPVVNNVNNINSTSVFVTLNPDHYITIQEQTNITYTDCGALVTKDVLTKAIQHNDYNKTLLNPFAKPTKDKVLRLTTLNGVELLPGEGITVNNYKVRYIKKPVDVDIISGVDSELPEIAHQEIINLAVSIALENIESQRLQGFVQVTESRQE